MGGERQLVGQAVIARLRLKLFHEVVGCEEFAVGSGAADFDKICGELVEEPGRTPTVNKLARLDRWVTAGDFFPALR